MLQKIRDALIGDIWSDTYETLADGGPICYNELSDLYRVSITIISVKKNPKFKKTLASS
jgi:hypothetical protein